MGQGNPDGPNPSRGFSSNTNRDAFGDKQRQQEGFGQGRGNHNNKPKSKTVYDIVDGTPLTEAEKLVQRQERKAAIAAEVERRRLASKQGRASTIMTSSQGIYAIGRTLLGTPEFGELPGFGGTFEENQLNFGKKFNKRTILTNPISNNRKLPSELTAKDYK